MMKVSKTLINLQPLKERVLFLLDRKVDMPIQLSWLEQLICNQQVVGSSPSIGSYLSFLFLGRYSSGQRGQTVNLLAQPSQVRILFSPQKTARIAQLARASAFQAEGRGFESRFSLQAFSRCSSGVERFLGKEEVTSSNLVIGSIIMQF